MPIQNSVYNYSILAAGGTVSLDVRAPYSKYVIGSTTSVTLLADMEFLPTGSPNEGCTFYIEYLGNIISDYAGGTTVKFFDVNLTDAQAASRCDITLYYTSGAWNVSVRPDFSEQQTNPILEGSLIKDVTIDTSKIINHKVTFVKMQQLTGQGYMLRGDSSTNIEEFNAKTSGNLLIGDGTTISSTAMSGDITINGSGVTTIGANKVLTTMIANNNVTTSKISTDLQCELITLLVSFEAAGGTTPSVGDFKIKLPYPGTVSEIYGYATKAIAGTDNGTIIAKDNAGTTMTAGTITFTAADPRGTAYTVTPSANNTFVAGDILTFTTAKTTAGGLVELSIKIIRS